MSEEKKTERYTVLAVAAITLMMLAGFALYILFSRTESAKPSVAQRERVEATLPAAPVRGMESNAFMIQAGGKEDTIAAAGQIFTPGPGTPVLYKLGFLFVQNRFTKQVSDFKLQVRLSEWAGDRPGAAILWVSAPCVIPSVTEDFQADWVDFDVPHLQLDPAKQYVAWVTLSGLENAPDAAIGIPGMGPRYSSPQAMGERKPDPAGSPYPQGRRVLYKRDHLDGDLSQVFNTAWEVHDAGHNLHFRMSFENEAPR